MLEIADLLRRVLVPFLLVGGSLLGILLSFLIAQRGVRELAWRRHQVLLARYRPLIDEVMQSPPSVHLLDRLRRTPARHRRVLTGLLLAPLHAARGDLVSYVHDAARALGLIERWQADLRNRRWWVRADAARALGAVEDRPSHAAIMNALEDSHDEVRAAAVDAVGRLGNLDAIPPLLEHLGDGSRYQRARVIEALRNLGPLVTPALVEHVRVNPEHARLAVEVIGLIGTAAATEPLLQWCSDERADVRAAALSAIGSIGLDDRGYYYALRGLSDTDPQARAMAARALGRGRREEAVSYLAERLDDEWLPAAQAAGALRSLGSTGVAALVARSRDQGQAGDLARQMLWSQQPAAADA